MHVWAVELRPRAAAAAAPELRTILGRYLGQEPEEIELAPGPHGKPRLADGPEGFGFNLSHSGPLALVAVAAVEVGVDVERIKPRRDLIALADRALRADDAAAVRDAEPEERAEVFYGRWTEHEARVKCLGTGIAAAAETHEPVAVRKLEVGPGFAAAVAVAGEEVPPCRCYLLG